MKIPAAALLLAGALLATGCDKNPVDAALDEMLDFDGVFEAGDGMQIELSGRDAIITRMGTTQIYATKAGDMYLRGMLRNGPREWSGWGLLSHGLGGRTTVRLTETSLSLGTDIPAHRTWARVGSGGSGGGSGGSGDGGGGGGGGLTSTEACIQYWRPILVNQGPNWRLTRLVRDGKDHYAPKDYPDDNYMRFATGTTNRWTAKFMTGDTRYYSADSPNDTYVIQYDPKYVSGVPCVLRYTMHPTYQWTSALHSYSGGTLRMQFGTDRGVLSNSVWYWVRK